MAGMGEQGTAEKKHPKTHQLLLRDGKATAGSFSLFFDGFLCYCTFLNNSNSFSLSY